MSYVENPEQRGWMIAEVAAVPGVREVIVFSADGLLLASSEGMNRDSADRLSANCSGLQSLARSLGREFGEDGGAVHQQMVEFNGGFLFMRSANGAHLAVVTGPVVDPKLVARQMQAQVMKIGAGNLSSPPRQESAR
ncbi:MULTISPECIES: roadblock/LC7 domain-containing protein [Streptomyces]|uniref:RarB n=2 Tax=Streptomyces scopuliridis TaxID=452529 RepID=A0A2T7TBM9_9ACTN|nr:MULTISPECIES: roadblock/LC7 domain-containing protein [Streptomyces]MCL7377848.1 roadblock/LC7 domain-containing protein [Streptomyces sp. 35G-GA-8]PVE12515.1 RarB [Streptomyces scopuliridis RB72]WSB32023.1 roadblock/LC7 domain-containing protein [Streptomyces scopuliridis]WSB96284.1 roadblock/LC7 domain-containing protein [Streptomyces scopuliridis]WSC10011.1 roadblock/LC7 domain-containing protein [Streptomyces scopuliridis]